MDKQNFISRVFKSFVAVTIAILLIFTQVYSPSNNNQVYANNQTQDIDLDIITEDKDASGESVYEYLTGKEIRAQAKLVVSGSDVNYPNGKMIVKVPKKTKMGIDIEKPSFVSSMNAKKSEESETEDHYIMTYTFDNLAGQVGFYRFPIKFKNEITPDKDTITPTLELQSENGNVIRNVEKTFTAKASSNWDSDIFIRGNWHGVYYVFKDFYIRDLKKYGDYKADGYYGYTRDYVDQKAPTTTGDGSKFEVRYYIDSFFQPENNDEAQYGVYNAKTMTFVVNVPEGAELTEASKKDGWVYDPNTKQAKRTVSATNLEVLDNGRNKLGKRTHIDLKYVNQPMDKVQKVSHYVTMDEGLPGEKNTAGNHANIKFTPNEIKSSTSTGHDRSGNTHVDTHAEYVYVYNPDKNSLNDRKGEDKEGLLHITYFYNTNNGIWDGVREGGFVTEFTSWTLQNLDNRLYFDKVGLYSYQNHGDAKFIEMFNNTENEVYGVREDGSEKLLMKNLRIPDTAKPETIIEENANTVVNVNDVNREFTKIVVKFPDKIIFSNHWVRLYSISKPTEEELNKFKNFEYTTTQRYERKASTEARILKGTPIVAVKTPSGWAFEGETPTGVSINSSTGEITLPQSDVEENIPVVATVYNSQGETTFKSAQYPDITKASTPIIHLTSNLGAEIYPGSQDANKLEITYGNTDAGRITAVIVKGASGWELEGDSILGLSVESSTGKVTLTPESIVTDSTMTVKVTNVNNNSYITHARTSYTNDSGVNIIKPTTVATKYENNNFVFTPYDDGVSNKVVLTYVPTNKDLNKTSVSTINESHGHNDWDQIEFPWLKARMENGNDHTVFYSTTPGANVRELYVRGLMGGSWTSSDFNAKFKTITLLPAGVNFVQHKGFTENGLNTSNLTDTPEVIENFRGTGKTAVIYSYDGTKKANLDDTTYLNGVMAGFKFDVEVTGLANEGDNIVEHYLIWDKDNIIKPHQNEYTDELDLDGDQDTTEKFIKKTNRLSLVLPHEVTGKKQVSIDKTNWVLQAPPQDIGEDVYYKINIRNGSLIGLNNFKALDVLPAIGDHMIVKNENNEYLPRETQLVTPMVEFLEDVPENQQYLENWQFLYSTDSQGSDLDAQLNANWKTKDDITNIEDVKSIKFEVKPGKTFGAKEEVNFIIHAKVPYNKEMNVGLKANNTMAISMFGTQYAELNMVTATNIKYSVNGIVYFDLNKNGQKDEGEVPLSGYTATLVDKDGNPYVDKGTNKPITALTDENGYYSMNVYERGDYYVKISKKYAEEEFTQIYQIDSVDEVGRPIKIPKPGTTMDTDGVVGNDTTQDINDVMTGNTPAFKLNAVTSVVTRNAGIFLSKGEITVNKTNEDNEVVNGAVFELLDSNGNTVEKDGAPYRVSTENGKAVFSSLEWATYKVKEISTLDKYRLDTTIHTVTVDKDNTPLVSISVTNNFKRGNISLIKKDRLNQSPLANVEFELLNENGEPVDANGKVATTGYKVRTNNLGVAIFSEVRLGNYKVRETETLASHIANPNKLYGTVTLTEDKATVQLKYTDNNAEHDTIYNDPKLATVTLKKVDAQSKEAIKGVEFALIQGENIDLSNENSYTVSYTQTTDKDGIATFKNVRYGDYKLIETKVLSEYVKIDNVIRDISVTEDGQKIEIGNIENTHIKGTVSVTKQDTETKENIAGVKFNLERVTTYDKTSVDVDKLKSQVGKENGLDGETKYSVEIVEETENTIKVKFTYTETTNDQGVAQFNGVIYGAYELSEISGPENYTINYEKRGVIIAANGQNVEFKDETTFFNKKIKGEVVVRKLDAETKEPLANATFTLNQNGEVKYTAISDEDGFVKFANVLYGSYTLEEVVVPKGYILNAEKLGLVISEDGQVVDLGEFYNRKIKGSVIVRKLDSKSVSITDSTNSGNNQGGNSTGSNTTSGENAEKEVAIEGVTFQLESIEKQADGQTPKYTYTVTTDSEGYAKFNNVYYGAYILKEIAGVDGYTINTEQRGVIISEDGQVVELENFLNKKVVGSVVLRKQDAETNEVLSGAKFILSKDGKQTHAAISNDEGIVKFTGVEYGVYLVSEVEAPTGYVLNTEQRAVAINEDGQVVELENFLNKKIRGEVVVQKQDVETNEVLAGAKFKLTQNGETKYEATTNEEGIAKFTNVLYGVYELEEAEAPTGYVLSTEKRGVIISEDGQVFDSGIFFNKQIKGEVYLVKVDSNNGNLKLSGAEFALQRNGQNLYTSKSDKDGIVKFTNVPYGEYQLVETKPALGYQKSSEVRNVKITEDGEVLDLGNFKNIKIPAEEIPSENTPGYKGKDKDKILPKTGIAENINNSLVGILILLSTVLLRRNYKK